MRKIQISSGGQEDKMGYEEVRSEIEKYDGVTLVAVSKTHPYEKVMEAYFNGARIFGENRVQELESKFPRPEDRPEGMKVYLIGQLQRNKVKKAVELSDRIESVDSMPLIEKIEREAEMLGKRIEVLLELNSGGEAQKAGFRDKDEMLSAASFILSSCPYIILRGLMTVGPLGFDDNLNRKAFTYAKSVFDEMKKLSSSIDTLSMGMSSDWKIAIECGSTEVRIGSLIFGVRS